jgi:methylenetetrahydrofolate dehydrogenase (NADP+)/methenyltetrahydrofolate cyclohydrolase
LTAQLIDGKAVASEIKSEIAKEVSTLRQNGITPGLGTLLVGEDPGSKSYVAGKHRDCAEVGIESIRVELPDSASENDIAQAIKDLNQATEVSGFIVQLPLPKAVNTNKLLELMDPAKDADGLHPINLGRLVLSGSTNLDSPLPCTPSGILELCKRYNIETKGQRVAIIGRGITVGRPLSLMMSGRGIDATVQVIHSASGDTSDLLAQSDIVVAAAGSPHMITKDDIKPGAKVFDVGITRTDDGLLGDVHPNVSEVAGFVSPNPGGVGPMTRVMLLKNVLKLAKTGS